MNRVGYLKDSLRHLSPAYFALVMATGIVSIAAHLASFPLLAMGLFIIAIAGYVALWMLTGARLYWFRAAMLADFGSHARGGGFLTIVAATALVGNLCIQLGGHVRTALILWYFGVALWLLLLYGWLVACMVGEHKPSLETGFNATWLLMTVSTESLAILGILLASHLDPWRQVVLFISLGLFLLGAFLYMLIGSLILYRLLFFPLSAKAVTPPYWIDMGAEAIVTLAGATLILHVSDWVFLNDLVHFLKGFTLFFWVTASWWIPVLFLLGAWRHLYEKLPFRYTPQYWSLVFPLGMYTVCTFQVSKAFHLPFLALIPRVSFYLALGAWAATAVGLLYQVTGRLLFNIETTTQPSTIDGPSS